MMKPYKKTRAATVALGVAAFIAFGRVPAQAQQGADEAPAARIIAPAEGAETSDFVTIHVDGVSIAEVLQVYSLQTGKSVVVGPDVVCDDVTVRLNNIPWKDALDVILKPYGFGYDDSVPGIIMVRKLESFQKVEQLEPLDSRVFKLKYLDAYDIEAIVKAQLTTRGEMTILETRALPGWEFGGEGDSSGAATEAGIRERSEKEDIQKSKTFVATDVPGSLAKISEILNEMDQMPTQVLIESKFLEISTERGSQIGLNYISAMENLETLSSASSLSPAELSSVSKILNATTGYPDPLQMGAAGGLSQENGLRLSSTELGGQGFELLFNLIAQDDDANVLSSPRLLTMNNQEAALLVGQKYPIIESNSNSGSGSSTTSTSLDYYENIGIQLNVIPQVCADNHVNMIVHPAVSEIEGFETGVVYSGGDSSSGTPYPILRIREAETQVMIKSGNVAAIGGLQTESDSVVVEKIPLLGDIPFLGRLFRNETTHREKVDLIIFIKATIIDNDQHAEQSAAREKARQDAMDLEILKDAAAIEAAGDNA